MQNKYLLIPLFSMLLILIQGININNKMESITKSKFKILASDQGYNTCASEDCQNGVLAFVINQDQKTVYQCVNCQVEHCQNCHKLCHSGDCGQKSASSKFQCPNCLELKDQQQKKTFCQCGYEICGQCYQSYLSNEIGSLKVPKCPSGCGQVLQSQLKQLLTSSKIQKYQQARFNKVIKQDGLKVCGQKDCTRGILAESTNENGKLIKICVSCDTVYCNFCLQLEHEGGCSVRVLLDLIKNLNYRICDNCKNAVEKNQGCNHMTCKCKYQFCYQCQEKYSSDHICPPKNETRRYKRISQLQERLKEQQKVQA